MNTNERTLSDLYDIIDGLKSDIKTLEDGKVELIVFLEEASLKIDGFSAILAGLTFSKEIGIETLLSAVGSVSFSLDELKKFIDKNIEEK